MTEDYARGEQIVPEILRAASDLRLAALAPERVVEPPQISMQHSAARYTMERMKTRDILRLIHEDGWYQVAQKGSHRQFKHPAKPGRVTIAGHPSEEMDEGTRKASSSRQV